MSLLNRLKCFMFGTGIVKGGYMILEAESIKVQLINTQRTLLWPILSAVLVDFSLIPHKCFEISCFEEKSKISLWDKESA